MSSFLLDTNVVSEFRKGDRADEGVRAWLTDRDDDDEIWLSVLVVGELRRGEASIRRRDEAAADAIGAWIDRLVDDFSDRILPVSLGAAIRWGLLNVPDPVPTIDGLLAATALENALTLVTRNVADVARTGVDVINPFTSSSA